MFPATCVEKLSLSIRDSLRSSRLLAVILTPPIFPVPGAADGKINEFSRRMSPFCESIAMLPVFPPPLIVWEVTEALFGKNNIPFSASERDVSSIPQRTY